MHYDIFLDFFCNVIVDALSIIYKHDSEWYPKMARRSKSKQRGHNTFITLLFLRLVMQLLCIGS